MATRPPATLPLPPPSAPPHPANVLGELYVRPAGAPFTPLQKWPRAKRLAELARVDQALAAFSDAAPGAAGPGLPTIGSASRAVAKKSLEKYRRRLVQALAPGSARR